MDYFSIFILYYYGVSLLCAIGDFHFPEYRNTNKKEDILTDYKKISIRVFKNMILSFPVFYIFENKILISDNIKNNIYNYHISYYYFLWLLLADLLFYTFHRLVHTPKLFFLHKQHHEYRYPYGYAAIYCGYIELVLGNLFPLLVPCYILDIPDELVRNLIGFSTIWTIVVSHSSLQNIDIKHNIHHQKLKYNYGLFITDYIFNTNY